VQIVKTIIGAADVQLILYILLALVPNLFLILWAMARLSRDVRLLKAKLDMVENDIGLLDQAISSLTSELQAIRRADNEAQASGAKLAPAKSAGRAE
jgi:hypothetical protein